MLTALLIPNNDTVPFLVPALLSTQGHYVQGRRGNTGPTDLTVLRWTVLPGGGLSQWDFGQQERSGHLCDAFIQRAAVILCSCCNTLHSIVSIPVLQN